MNYEFQILPKEDAFVAGAFVLCVTGNQKF